MFEHFNLYVIAFLFFITVEGNDSAFREKKSIVNDEYALKKITESVSDTSYLRTALDRIIVPRVVGTANHTAVLKYITGELEALNWHVELDEFADRTPLGSKSFANIIATPNPNARRYLDLACHYDSKLYDNFVFHGATDSAVPCAMLLQLARSLDAVLKRNQNDDLALRLIFFDGEEAFVSWSERDSLYGARHLAEKWASTPYAGGGLGFTQLHRVDLLVLLDLLGTPNPRFYSFFSDTMDAYRILINAQTKLSQRGLIHPNAKYFNKKSSIDRIEDDHVPFLRRGVPVLHIIPVPFPRQWHTEDDNINAISFPTVDNLVKIIAVFVAEYLQLTV